MTPLKNNVNNAHRPFDLVDFHSHILPKMDDGAKNVDESLAMLRLMSSQGVKKVVATPHFYADREEPSSFIARRRASCDLLRPRLENIFPHIFMGAEVAYFSGISRCEALGSLCIAKTNLLLVEMPFESTWPDSIYEELRTIKNLRGMRPIIAHIERYPIKLTDVLPRLIQDGMLIQSNAEFFLSFSTRRRACDLLQRGYIRILGSDCHHIDHRMPNLGEAADYIAKKSGDGCVKRAFAFASSLLPV